MSTVEDRTPSGFDGLRAVVTGGASGIGLATAQLLAARGAMVAVLDLDLADLRPRSSVSPPTSPTMHRCALLSAVR